MTPILLALFLMQAAPEAAPAAPATEQAAPAAAETPAAAAAPAPAAEPERQCRIERQLGTRFSRRVCTTPAEREAELAATRQYFEDLSTSGGHNNTAGN